MSQKRISKDGEELYVEVKGLSGESVNIELTPNEYEKMKDNKDKYRIFVLTNADKKKGDYYIFSYEINGKLIDEKKKVELTIEERTGARCRESL
jgi:dolichyl-phosphate-mannose--protein O-mannosyl transferase